MSGPDDLLGNSLPTVFSSAPDLYNTPSLAIAAANDPTDPAGTGQALAHLNNAAAFQQVAQNAQQTHGHSWWSSAVHAVTGTVGEGLHILAKPLGAVQHEYRYLKAVWAQHGPWAAIAQGTAMFAAGVGGGLAGSLIGNPELGILAAEGTGYALGRLTYTDSWKWSQTHGGSIGRDIAHGVGLDNTDSGWGKYVSGATDALFDITSDPLVVAPGAMAVRKGAKGLEAASYRFFGHDITFHQEIAARSTAVQNLVSRFGPGRAIDSAERVDNAYKAYGGYRRAVDHIATLDQAGVVAHYPELQALASDLGKADHAAEVHSIFRYAADDAEWQRRLQDGVLPSRSLMRVPATKVIEKWRGDVARADEVPLIFGRNPATLTRDAEGRVIDATQNTGLRSYQLGLVFRPLSGKAWAGAFSRKVRTFSGYAPYAIDPATGQLSHEFSLATDDNLQGLLRAMRYSLGERTAQKRLAEYIDAKLPNGMADVARRKEIYSEIQAEIWKAAGFPDDPEAFARLVQKGRYYGTGSQHSVSYMFGHEAGDDANQVTHEGGTSRLAGYVFQAQDLAAFPDFRVLNQARRSLTRYQNLYGKIDEFAADHYTNAYFKPMALLSLGFGLRVAAAEMIPATMRYGAWNMLKRRVGATAAKMDYKLTTARAAEEARYLEGLKSAKALGEDPPMLDEGHHILAAASKLVGGIDNLINNDKARALALRLVIDNQSHIIRQGSVAAAGHSGYTAGDDPVFAHEFGIDQSLKRHGRNMPAMRGTGEFINFTPEDKQQFYGHWQYGLVRRAREKSVKLIAADYKHGLSVANPTIELRRGVDFGSAEDAKAALTASRGAAPTEGGITPDAIVPAHRDLVPDVGAGRVSTEERQRRAAAYAAHRESLRIQGINPDTGLAYTVHEDPYAYERTIIARHGAQDPTQFAAHRVDDVRNFVTGRDGTLHEDLLNKFINGDNRISLSELKAKDPASLPRGVPGEVTEPTMGSSQFSKVLSSGFKFAIDPVLNYLSREPLYFNEVMKHYDVLEGAVKRGIINEDTALAHAQARASRTILPQIHNTHLKSQFHILARNLMPFFFAQEQAMKRAGHLIIKNPAAFREYQLIAHSLSDPGFIHADDQGNKYMMIPFVGELGAMSLNGLAGMGMPVVGGLPMTVQGNTESLKTVIPELTPPGTSPFLAITLSKLADLDPMLAPFAKTVLGDRGYNPDKWSALIPNTALRTALKATLLGNEGDTQFANAMMTSIQAAAYHGQIPGPDASPREQQAFIDRIKNNARSVLMVKALLATVSPLTPQVDQSDAGLRDEFYKLVKSKGTYDAALLAFMKEHGNKAVSYTVARSTNLTGANIEPTSDAVNFVLQHQGLLKSHPWGAAFTTPQNTSGGGDVQVFYNELLKNHLRERETPSQFLDSTYSRLGADEFFKAYDAHKAALAANQDPLYQQQETANFNAWKEGTFRLTNPIAYDYLFGPERTTNAAAAFQDISNMFATNQQPDNEQARLLQGLMQDYQTHREALAALGTDPRLGHQRQVEKDNWQAYLDQTAKQQPLLANVIDAVFNKLQYVSTLGA